MSRSQLRSYISLNTKTSSKTAHPTTSVSVPTGYRMLGGGIKVDWTGSGNLATMSKPSGTSSWAVKSKDHIESSPATVTAYVLGIKPEIRIGNKYYNTFIYQGWGAG